jgi:hypothetical protein
MKQMSSTIRHRDDDQDQAQRIDRAGAAALEQLDERGRQAGDDARHDDQRDAVADAAAGDLLTQPHQEQGAADQADDRADAEQQAGLDHGLQPLLRAEALEPDRDEIALDRGEADGAVAGILVEALAAALAFLLDRVERGDSDVASCTTIEAVM